MQDKSDRHSEFSERTEALSENLGILLSDLPSKIGVSASMFYAYRTGKQPISSKAWRKLESAESAAGIVRFPQGLGDETSVREDSRSYRTSTSESLRSPGEPTIMERMETLQRGYDETREALADANRKLDALMDLFTKMPKS